MGINISFERFSELYGNDKHVLEKQYKRYSELLNLYRNVFPDSQPVFFSTPGRTEIGGNHTDHNRGKVIAAAVNLDSIAAASPAQDNIITIYSGIYPEPFIIDISNLSPINSEKGTTASLIRGIVNGFNKRGFRIGGFNAYIESDVMVGSGLSSSASVEILIGTILNYFYNFGKMNPIVLSKICQEAENKYFGKPCGLMDQITCAMGGIVSIDFNQPENPIVETIKCSFSDFNFTLVVVDTGGSHSDLTSEYASIPEEMKSVAFVFGKEVCRDINIDELLKNIHRIRSSAGDRAFLRAFHFLKENDRVEHQITALRAGDIDTFLRLVRESGDSSYRWLQNCFTTTNPREQGIAIALALTEQFLCLIEKGACRVHGGGFAGTIQTFIPTKSVHDYKQLMENVFSKDCVKILEIRNCGTVKV